MDFLKTRQPVSMRFFIAKLFLQDLQKLAGLR